MARTSTFLLAGLAVLTMGFAQSDRPTEPVPVPKAASHPLRSLEHSAFKPGEKLSYVLHYGFVNAGVATMELKEEAKDMNGRKILHARGGHGEEKVEEIAPELQDPAAFEAERVKGAIRTDLILSGEIVAISLGQVASAPFGTQAMTLYAIAVVMTVGVYGVVGGLVKLDDAGEAMVRRGGPTAALGRLVVKGTPTLLKAISVVGTVAMLMVGGHILVEGIPPIEHAVHGALEGLPGALASVAGVVADVVVGGIAGLIVVGVIATGIPGRVARLFKRKRAE